LRTKDFAQMSADEIARANKAVAALAMGGEKIRLRRWRSTHRGKIDPRATLRASLRAGGGNIALNFREHAQVYAPIVALCDISGSMSEYTRTFLHFLHALGQNRGRVHVFLFGTRLTNVTRALRAKDVDQALGQCAGAAEDWSGGTRIGASLHEFNRQWSRRVLGQGAVCILFTDGLERDRLDMLSAEMERLHKSCRRLIWVNPLLRYAEFRAKASGVRAMLPHVDEFRPVHNLAAIADLVDALSAKRNDGDPKSFLAAA
jgi:hypothetical protein